MLWFLFSILKIEENKVDTSVKGIVLKTKDYKDSDKLITILTLEKGKILVKARGVKKPSSKLKAFCQSFCFADFELVESKAGYVLTGVNEIENFYNLTLDIDKFSYAFCVLEIVDKICAENQEYVNIFIDCLKCLQQMSYGSSDCRLILSKFILNILNYEGFNVNLNKCSNCKTPLVGDLFFDLNRGEVLCSACKTFDCLELEKSVFSALKILSNCEYDKLSTVKFSSLILDKTLKLLTKNINYKFDIKLNSIEL